MMPLPKSWRDLSSEELRHLLDRREPLFTVADLIFAQWEVAAKKTEAAHNAYWAAENAYHDAWEASIKARTGKSLLAKEEAEKCRDRWRVRVGRAQREQERLYAAWRAAVEAA